eukprot:g5019.t1
MAGKLVRSFARCGQELNNEDGKGQFTANVLLTFLNKGSTQRKFMRVGIEMSELTELVLDSLEIPRGTRNADRLREGLDTMFSSESSTAQREEAVRDFRGTITAMRQEHTLFSSSDFMERVLRLRKPTPIPRWKILFKQIFEQDGEFTAALESPQTQARLESLGLDLDLVEEMFEVIDVDGSDDVTEAELLLGVELLLELQKESDDIVDVDDLRERLQQHGHRQLQVLQTHTEEEPAAFVTKIRAEEKMPSSPPAEKETEALRRHPHLQAKDSS